VNEVNEGTEGSEGVSLDTNKQKYRRDKTSIRTTPIVLELAQELKKLKGYRASSDALEEALKMAIGVAQVEQQVNQVKEGR